MSDLLDIYDKSRGQIGANTLVIKGLVRWKLTDANGTQVQYYPLSTISQIADSGKTWTRAIGEFILVLPINGEYTFSFSSATSATFRIKHINTGDNLNVSAAGRTPSTLAYRKEAGNDLGSINPFLVCRIEATVIGGISLSVSGAVSIPNLDNFIYVLCDRSLNRFCNYLYPAVASGNILSSSSCLSINGNTLVSKGTVRWSIFNKATPNRAFELARADQDFQRVSNDTTRNARNTAITNYENAFFNIYRIVSDSFQYTSIGARVPGTNNYDQTVIGECLLKFPVAATYSIDLESEAISFIFINDITSRLSPINFQKSAFAEGRRTSTITITTTKPDEIYKMMIISNGAPNTTFFIRKNLGPINSLDDIVFSLCDSNTLTACTSLLPNNKTIIQGMVQRAWYIDIPKNFEHFRNSPMPDPTKGSLFDTVYTSTIGLTNAEVDRFGSLVGGRICTVIYTGYITFPKTAFYNFNAGADDNIMVLFGDENMFIDMNAKPLDSQVVYARSCCGYSSTPVVDKRLSIEANKTYRFMVIYHNNQVAGSFELNIREGNTTPFNLPLSWISSDFTIDYLNTYQSTFNARCGKNDTEWTNGECPDLLNQNIGNILVSRNINNRRYSDLIIAQCSDTNTGTKPSGCSKLYKFDSIEPSIVNSYCNDQNRFILDPQCREYAIRNPNTNDWANKQLNYCTENYNRITSEPCISYYNSRNNKTSVYAKFCSDNNGAKMLTSKEAAEDCLTTDVDNRTKNINVITNTCNPDNTTLFKGFCNDVAPNALLNKAINESRISSCTDARIDADLTTQTGCVPYLSDEVRINTVDTRIITYCENGNRFNNALCSKFYGTDGTPIITSTNNVIQKSIDYKIYRECINNNKFATDKTCNDIVINNLNKYASNVIDYCDDPANIASDFCSQSFKKLIDDNNQICSSQKIGFENKTPVMNLESFINPESLAYTLSNMHSYGSCKYSEPEEYFDKGFIFILILMLVILSLVISYVIVKYKHSGEKSNKTENDLNKYT